VFAGDTSVKLWALESPGVPLRTLVRHTASVKCLVRAVGKRLRFVAVAFEEAQWTGVVLGEHKPDVVSSKGLIILQVMCFDDAMNLVFHGVFLQGCRQVC